jgi:serine/threonine protein kinase
MEVIMRESLTRCPACQSIYLPGDAICATCGRVLAAPAPETIPIDTAPALETIPIGTIVEPAASTMAALFPPLLEGQSLAQGRYTIQRPLSRGGMGALYLATDREAFDRTVVIKGLLDDAAGGSPQDAQAARTRFEREARTLAALAYPTIPQIFSYFQEGSQNYIVMAYIEGHDLSQRLTYTDPSTGQPVQGSAYPLPDVLRWGVALCRTLEYLSRKMPPVIHQDIKPANLILNPHSDELFLVDFGAARARMHMLAGSQARTVIFGTPGYAAPEQYEGQSDPRSDVYALAATLYHLATDDDPSVHPFSFPRLTYLGYLGPILRAALAPDWAQRPTAAILREQIEAILTPESWRVLHTPDQVALTNELELAAWCEQHWEAAADWLYHGLPDHIQMAWVKLALADKLRRCAQQHPADPNAGLDAAIAQLDPSGFGALGPILTADASEIDLGTFAPGTTVQMSHRSLAIRNGGRRYICAAVALPKWISTPTPEIALPPGQQTTLDLQANLDKAPILPRHAAVVLQAGDGAGVNIPLHGQLMLDQRQQHADASPLLFIVIAVLFLGGMFLLAAIGPILQALFGAR